MDTSSLRSAYADFLELARTGEFRPPVQGWSARQVIAHVAANDEMLTATTREVLAGTAQRHYNHDAIDTSRLDRLIGDRSVGELADWWRRRAAACATWSTRYPKTTAPWSTRTSRTAR
jgi:hypothetical protein